MDFFEGRNQSCLTTYEMKQEEKHHNNHYPTLFKKRQGMFYVQCPIDRPSYTRPLMTVWEQRVTESDSRGRRGGGGWELIR